MTIWTIQLSDDRLVNVEADELTTRDGSLWALAATAKPPAKLVPVLILARGTWQAAHPADITVLPDVPTPQQTTARFA